MTLTVYFSGTGNTAYVARQFAAQMGGKCLSIEDEADFAAEIAAADTIAVCYPIYGSRVPLIMRLFAARHADALRGKELVILVTQATFSGDGARVFTDIFPVGHFNVIYAVHLYMPNNICNFGPMREVSAKGKGKRMALADKRLARICADIAAGKVVRRGFTTLGRLLGTIQGRAWQGDSGRAEVTAGSFEARAKDGIQIDADCTGCGLCVTACPMQNLEAQGAKIQHRSNCTACFRCVNLCPHKAITVFFHKKPKWQYKGLIDSQLQKSTASM